MEKIDIILWVLSGGFGLMLVMWHSLTSNIEKQEVRIGKQDDKLETIQKDLQNMSTKIAVIESRLTDISNNVSHLMWHHQAIPKENEKEN